MFGLYARVVGAWETHLANLDQNRTERPFEWGLDWLGLAHGLNGSSGSALAAYNEHHVTRSDKFFGAAEPEKPIEFRLDGSTLQFPSAISTPHPENNTVWAEFFPSPRADGRAVLVLPQWNSDDQSHIGLCKLLQKLGITALRMSKAYHHRRRPAETKRADYHVSSNLGRTIHATRQSVLDSRACLDWLAAQGYSRLGILGTSLGSCVALLTLAHDRRIRAAVFNHVSMNFSDVVWTGVSCRHIRRTLDGHVNQEEMRKYWRVISPSAYLHRLTDHPSAKLLIWAGHDTTFRPEYSRETLEGFIRYQVPHDVFYLPCGHYTTAKPPFVWMDGFAMSRFLLKHL